MPHLKFQREAAIRPGEEEGFWALLGLIVFSVGSAAALEVGCS